MSWSVPLSRTTTRWGVLFLALLVVPVFPAPARAHRDDYIDETFVYQTLKKGEFELELWCEARSRRQGGAVGWYTMAFESGITSRWTLDGATQFLGQGGGLEFGRLRVESRYRFAREGEWPLDLATSAEYELESDAATGAETEHTLTPRLVISRDVLRELNTTLNLDLPIPLWEPRSATFAYAVGVRYPAERFLRSGLEFKGEPSRHTATLFPQVWFAFPREMTLKVGTGIGLTGETDRFVGRVVFEAEF